MSGPLTRYAARLARAAKTAVPALVEETGLDRAAASAAFATACALTLSGLARHQRRRPDDAAAARTVVEKYGRPADLDAVALAVRAHLADPRLDARVGGLLGDAGPRAVAWLAVADEGPLRGARPGAGGLRSPGARGPARRRRSRSTAERARRRRGPAPRPTPPPCSIGRPPSAGPFAACAGRASPCCPGDARCRDRAVPRRGFWAQVATSAHGDRDDGGRCAVPGDSASAGRRLRP